MSVSFSKYEGNWRVSLHCDGKRDRQKSSAASQSDSNNKISVHGGKSSTREQNWHETIKEVAKNSGIRFGFDSSLLNGILLRVCVIKIVHHVRLTQLQARTRHNASSWPGCFSGSCCDVQSGWCPCLEGRCLGVGWRGEGMSSSHFQICRRTGPCRCLSANLWPTARGRSPYGWDCGRN